MVRVDLVGRKAAKAGAWLNDAERTFALPKAEFLGQPDARDLATFRLFLAIQECIDISAHWLADQGWGTADDAGGAFDVLAERGVISAELAGGIRATVGLRNRIAHGYATVDLVICEKAGV
jgi:uncharacterized protein YutE (UPF0331/DUF86 family)